MDAGRVQVRWCCGACGQRLHRGAERGEQRLCVTWLESLVAKARAGIDRCLSAEIPRVAIVRCMHYPHFDHERNQHIGGARPLRFKNAGRSTERYVKAEFRADLGGTTCAVFLSLLLLNLNLETLKSKTPKQKELKEIDRDKASGVTVSLKGGSLKKLTGYVEGESEKNEGTRGNEKQKRRRRRKQAAGV